jgi:hypothetical protein
VYPFFTFSETQMLAGMRHLSAPNPLDDAHISIQYPHERYRRQRRQCRWAPPQGILKSHLRTEIRHPPGSYPESCGAGMRVCALKSLE